MRLGSSPKPLPNEAERSKMKDTGPSMNKLTLIFAGLSLLLLLAVAFLVVKPKIRLPQIGLPTINLTNKASASGYQAVFLSNGQVYFGQLQGFPGNEPVLKDVYYLKVGTILTPGEAGKAGEVKVEGKAKEATGAATAKNPSPATRTGLTLVKLGEEIHGPQDEIKLNRDQILFVENLRENSQVVDAINRYKASLKK